MSRRPSPSKSTAYCAIDRRHELGVAHGPRPGSGESARHPVQRRLVPRQDPEGGRQFVAPVAGPGGIAAAERREGAHDGLHHRRIVEHRTVARFHPPERHEDVAIDPVRGLDRRQRVGVRGERALAGLDAGRGHARLDVIPDRPDELALASGRGEHLRIGREPGELGVRNARRHLVGDAPGGQIGAAGLEGRRGGRGLRRRRDGERGHADAADGGEADRQGPARAAPPRVPHRRCANIHGHLRCGRSCGAHHTRAAGAPARDRAGARARRPPPTGRQPSRGREQGPATSPPRRGGPGALSGCVTSAGRPIR